MFLTQEEIRELTGKRARSAQSLALNHMGLIYKIRPDGSIAVLESHVRKEMGGMLDFKKQEIHEPNWAAL